ncbi:MAG: HmuY family protein [Pseudomonadota bacterium]|jgi:hypothetical protein|nr:HmuY family protein [Pseudomonadota bacterium]
MKKSSYSIAILSAVLAACGGGGGGSSPEPEPPPPATGFTEEATWTVTLPAAGESICYDFDAKAEAACTGTAWDVKLASGGRSADLYTNSGPSGEGGGGAFATPFDHTWEDLLAWSDAFTDSTGAVIPARLYFADTANSVFTGDNGIQSEAFEYGLGGEGDHLLYPTYKVFLVTTDSSNADAIGTAANPVFAVQVTGYYGGAAGTESGHVSFQWVDRADSAGTVKTATVDARSDWVYFDLVTGTESSETGEWQIAFNRYNVKLNGGASATGTGAAAGFLAKVPAGFYDGDGNPVAAAIQGADPASMAAELTAADLAGPAMARNWVQDSIGSQLAPAYQGSYPGALDYGWYKYYPTADAASAAGLPAVAHLLGANPEQGTLVRSGEGNSYARMRLADIVYADPNDSGSATTWTFEFGIQPASAAAN